ncbi:MAG: hypothetical protein U0869_09000 [Chloroflexota bacterium]
MNERDLIRRWPRLFHVAAPGAWDTNSTFGLRSTSAALDLHGVTERAIPDLVEPARR